MLLHPDGFELCRIICPRGVFSSTQVLHGLLNATAYFQSTLEPLFSKLRENMKQYVEDFNLNHENEDGLLNIVEEFCHIADEHDLVISAKKPVFFCTSITWYGRIVDKDG